MPPKDNAKAAASNSDRLLTFREIEENGGPSYWTLRRAAQRGEIKITRLSARLSRVRASEYQRYLDARTA